MGGPRICCESSSLKGADCNFERLCVKNDLHCPPVQSKSSGSNGSQLFREVSCSGEAFQIRTSSPELV